MDASNAGLYAAAYFTDHPELERSNRTGHAAGLGILSWYGLSALWSLSLWKLVEGVFYSALVAKGAHAWQRWSSVR